MPKASYLLIITTIAGLIVSLILYRTSWEKSQAFSQRVYTVNTVLLLLEKVDKLDMMLHILSKVQASDSTLAVGWRCKSEVDSLLNHLHAIVLYDDQRQRIDSIKYFISGNFENWWRKDGARPYIRSLEIITRARDYADMRLGEQKATYESESAKTNAWVNLILALTLLMLLVGSGAIIYERNLKRKLKDLHELILSNASMGINVYEASRSVSNTLNFVYTLGNYGAICTDKVLINLNDYPHHNPMMLEQFRQVLASGKSLTTEISYPYQNEIYWFITNVSKVSEHHVAFYYQDITRIKIYERELHDKVSALQKVNKDLEQFAHATSHDLQEPFRKIQVMADMVHKNQDPERNEKYLEAIIRASVKGTDLIQQILNYSRIEFNSIDFTDVDLNKVVAQVIDDFELKIMEKHATFHVGTLPVIKGNRIQMIQLFMNLISNALKFSSADRAPVIDIYYERILSEKDKPMPDNDYYAIYVADNGVGFDAQYKDKIFNAFQRLNTYHQYPGFGLGLSLCKKIVLNHKGDINASSVYGKGSIFKVILPVY